MRPERVRQFPARVLASSVGRRLLAANDNKPDLEESVASILIGRSLIVGASLLAVTIVAGWSLWLGRALWRHFV
jgi:hypothetical protein